MNIRPIVVAIVLGLFLAVSTVAVGWAQPATPPMMNQMMRTPASPAPSGPGTK